MRWLHPLRMTTPIRRQCFVVQHRPQSRTRLQTPSVGPVPLEPVDELVGLGEEREVAAAHLVRVDAQSITHHPSLEVGREEAIVPAQQEARRHVGPPLERPRILEQVALPARSRGAPTRRRDRRRRRGRRSRARRTAPATRSRCWSTIPRPTRRACGTIAATITSRSDRDAGAHERTDEAAERLGDDDQLGRRSCRGRDRRRWRRPRRRRGRRTSRCSSPHGRSTATVS